MENTLKTYRIQAMPAGYMIALYREDVFLCHLARMFNTRKQAQRWCDKVLKVAGYRRLDTFKSNLPRKDQDALAIAREYFYEESRRKK